MNGKVGGAFTSTATQHGGQEVTLFSIITNLLHFGMVVVGLDYGYAGQMRLDEVTGGSPYGATTIAGTDGTRQPSAERTRRRALPGARDRENGPSSWPTQGGRHLPEQEFRLPGGSAPLRLHRRCAGCTKS